MSPLNRLTLAMLIVWSGLFSSICLSANAPVCNPATEADGPQKPRIAGSREISIGGTSLHIDCKGNLTMMDCNRNGCFALTDKSEIVFSSNGSSWKVFDFNEQYSDYYGEISLVGIAAGPGSVAVAGTDETGSPVVFISTRGTVWSQRILEYTLGSETFSLHETPLSISADLEKDEFVLQCTDNTLFFIPPCSHCNRLVYYGGTD